MFGEDIFPDMLRLFNAEDLEKLREMEITGEMGPSMNTVEAVMASLNDVQSLSEAFNGCRGVFHTAAFVDPAGLSGYSVCVFTLSHTPLMTPKKQGNTFLVHN